MAKEAGEDPEFGNAIIHDFHQVLEVRRVRLGIPFSEMGPHSQMLIHRLEERIETLKAQVKPKGSIWNRH